MDLRSRMSKRGGKQGLNSGLSKIGEYDVIN